MSILPPSHQFHGEYNRLRGSNIASHYTDTQYCRLLKLQSKAPKFIIQTNCLKFLSSHNFVRTLIFCFIRSDERKTESAQQQQRLTDCSYATNGSRAGTDQAENANDRIWWAIVRLKWVLSRMQDRIISSNCETEGGSLSAIRERAKDRAARSSPPTSHSAGGPLQGAGGAKVDFNEETMKDWQIVSDLCSELADVVVKGREIVQTTAADSPARMCLANFSYRAATTVVQSILRSEGTLLCLLRSIDDLLADYQKEALHSCDSQSSDKANVGTFFESFSNDETLYPEVLQASRRFTSAQVIRRYPATLRMCDSLRETRQCLI